MFANKIKTKQSIKKLNIEMEIYARYKNELIDDAMLVKKS